MVLIISLFIFLFAYWFWVLIADMVGNIICPCIACCMLSCWGIRSCYIYILCFVFLWNISWIRFSFIVWCVRIMFSASYFIYQFLARWSKCEIWLWLVPSTSFTCAMFLIASYFPLFLMSIHGKLGTVILEHQDVLSASESKVFMGLGEIIPKNFKDVCEDGYSFFCISL